MSSIHSVSELLRGLKEGDSQAAQQLWDRCINRLIGTARKKLRNLPRRAVDEEDVALSAFDAFFRGVEQGRFLKLDNREDLWQILAMLTERKAGSVLRTELAAKRGGGLNCGESVFEKLIQEASAFGIDQMPDPEPAVVDGFTQEVRELLDGLNDGLLRKITLLKLEGYTNSEVAEQTGIALRSVERKLALIRQEWTS